jgi:hypothetical protein
MREVNIQIALSKNGYGDHVTDMWNNRYWRKAFEALFEMHDEHSSEYQLMFSVWALGVCGGHH